MDCGTFRGKKMLTHESSQILIRKMAKWQHSLHSLCYFFIRTVFYQVVFNRIASPPPFGLQENKMPFRQMRDSSHSLSEEVYFKSVSLSYNLYTIIYRGLKSMIWWILRNLHTRVSIATIQIQNVSIILRSLLRPCAGPYPPWGLEQLLIYVEVNSQFLDFYINGSHIRCTPLCLLFTEHSTFEAVSIYYSSVTHSSSLLSRIPFNVYTVELDTVERTSTTMCLLILSYL